VLTCVDVGAEVLSGEAEAMVAPLPVCSMKRIPTCTERQDPSSNMFIDTVLLVPVRRGQKLYIMKSDDAILR
jgi:hypothetical protein